MGQLLTTNRDIQGLDIDDVICNPGAYEPEIVLAVIATGLIASLIFN